MDLPEIQFVDTDTEATEQRIITRYEGLTGLSLAPGDPVRFVLQAVALEMVQLRQEIDFTGKQNLLYYAQDDYLDHIGLPMDTSRLDAVAATTTERFVLAALQPGAVTIPAGTRVTPDGKLFFATLAAAEIPSGALYVDVPVQCQTAGSTGNGYLADQINRLVDREGDLGLIETVTNLTTTADGSDAEQDDSYRERIQWSPEKFSCAGPRGAYRYWAKSVSPAIEDVQVYSPQPGQAAVVLLTSDGGIPSAELIAAVHAVLNPEDMRPLCDEVLVQAPAQVPFTIGGTYYITVANQSLAASIQASVTAAVAAYQTWQRARLGRDIDPAHLIYLLKQAGAGRVDITLPAYGTVKLWQVAQCTSAALTYGGLIDG